MASAWRVVRPTSETSPWHPFLDDAVSLIRSCRLDEAVRIADEALSTASDDPSVTGRAHSFKGEVASIRGALDETMSEYALAIADLEETALIGSLARARRGRAEAYFNLALYSSALEEATRARMMVDSIASDGIRRRASLESFLCEGLIRLELNQPAVAAEHSRSAADLIEDDCDRFSSASIECSRGSPGWPSPRRGPRRATSCRAPRSTSACTTFPTIGRAPSRPMLGGSWRRISTLRFVSPTTPHTCTRVPAPSFVTRVPAAGSRTFGPDGLLPS